MIADDSKYLIEIISYFDIYIVFCHNLLIIISKFIPCFENEALGAVFTVLTQLVVFQNSECLVDATLSTDILWI